MPGRSADTIGPPVDLAVTCPSRCRHECHDRPPRRHHRRRPHSVLPQQHRVRRPRQLRHVGEGGRRAGRALRPARRRARRSRARRGDQALVRTGTSGAKSRCRRACRRTTPGITMQRACGTSLDTTITIANKIALGQIDAGIAGGSDTTSATCRSCTARSCAGACSTMSSRASRSAQKLAALTRLRSRRAQARASRASPSRAPARAWASTASMMAQGVEDRARGPGSRSRSPSHQKAAAA